MKQTITKDIPTETKTTKGKERKQPVRKQNRIQTNLNESAKTRKETTTTTLVKTIIVTAYITVTTIKTVTTI